MFYNMYTESAILPEVEPVKPRRRKASRKRNKPQMSLRDLMQMPSSSKTHALKAVAIKTWSARGWKDIVAAARAYTSLMSLPFDRESIGMHQDIFAKSSVSHALVMNEYRLFLQVFMPDPHGMICSMLHDTDSDDEIVHVLRNLIISLSTVHVLSPDNRRVSVVQALLLSKKCRQCYALNLECSSCAWSAMTKVTNEVLSQRLVSILPHVWDGFAVKKHITAMLDVRN